MKRTKKIRLYVLRHGERVDEVDFEWSRKEENKKCWYDPPLTVKGKKQAAMAANYLERVHRVRNGCFKRVYCSTLRRAVETAAMVTSIIHDSEVEGKTSSAESERKGSIILDPGLAHFAAAIESAQKITSTLPTFVDKKVWEATYSSLRFEGSVANKRGTKAMEALECLIKRECDAGSKDVLVVSHRENIRDVAKLCKNAGALERSGRVHLGYCAIGVFECEILSDGSGDVTWKKVGILQQTGESSSARECRVG